MFTKVAKTKVQPLKSYAEYSIERLVQNFSFGQVKGLDLTSITSTQVDEIHKKVIEHKLLVFRDQSENFDAVEQRKFTQKFGDVLLHPRKNARHPEVPEIVVATNIVKDKKDIPPQ